jgi:hypothetical protein
VRWSEASRARRAEELGKIGTMTRFVLLDLEDAARVNPALGDELARCKTVEEQEQLAFEWFDKHPQPTNRTDWLGSRDTLAAIAPPLGGTGETFRTPDWPGGRLPRIDGDEGAEVDPARPGRKGEWYPGESIELAVRQLRPFEKQSGRNKAAKNAHLSTRAVDTILEHMRAGRLATTDAHGWLVINGRKRATPSKVRLVDLETA